MWQALAEPRGSLSPWVGSQVQGLWPVPIAVSAPVPWLQAVLLQARGHLKVDVSRPFGRAEAAAVASNLSISQSLCLEVVRQHLVSAT